MKEEEFKKLEKKKVVILLGSILLFTIILAGCTKEKTYTYNTIEDKIVSVSQVNQKGYFRISFAYYSSIYLESKYYQEVKSYLGKTVRMTVRNSESYIYELISISKV